MAANRRFDRPQRVALVPADPSDTTACLVADVADALPVYAGPLPVQLLPGEKTHKADAAILICGSQATFPPSWPASAPPLPANAPLYGIVAHPSHSTQDAAAALTALRSGIQQADGTWAGGIALAGGRLIAAAAHTTRMGYLRRARSEATDELILALLDGRELKERIVGCPVPHLVYQGLIDWQRI